MADNFAIQNKDVSDLKLGYNRHRSYNFDEPNSSGEFTLEAGQLVGVIAATGKIKILDATATDGSQIPVGVVADDVVMDADATDVPVPVVIAGRVAKQKLKFSGSQSLDSTIDYANGTGSAVYPRRLRESLEGDTLGIEVIDVNELSSQDNQ